MELLRTLLIGVAFIAVAYFFGVWGVLAIIGVFVFLAGYLAGDIGLFGPKRRR